MKLTCAIIDDEPLAVELMEGYVRKTPFLELSASFGSGTSAFEALRAHPVDLLFCDIQMPGISGMELARLLPARTRVIFTTTFSHYAVEGFQVRAIDYLLKPISYADFLAAAARAHDWFELKRRAEGAAQGGGEKAAEAAAEEGAEESAAKGAAGGSAAGGSAAEEGGAKGIAERSAARAAAGAPQSIFVRTEYRLQQIPLDRIRYIEGLKDYVKLHVEGEAHPVLSLMSLKTLEEQLPADRFIRVHRSYIVQPAKIRTIERNRIRFDKEYIPISENYRQAFFDFLAAHALIV